ncbi:MAG TPA: J domain-containing protein [Sphingomicrobium sp.]|nr:J domain-containing protein [Sphingomicrobium sp.]
MHGRVEGAAGLCAVPGCGEPGEYKAPLEPANFNGPGSWRLLCLEHVRVHNASYNYFQGMSTDEISEAQTPYGGWERETRAFASAGMDPPPAWSNFSDPLDAIAARFRRGEGPAPSRFSRAERRALSVLGLGEDTDLHTVRKRYSELVRRFHPDRNGGDRSHEDRLGQVIGAWQTLRGAAALA